MSSLERGCVCLLCSKPFPLLFHAGVKYAAVRMLGVAFLVVGVARGVATSEKPCTGSGCSNNGSMDYCFGARIRSTVLQGLPFGGVPTVLALDFMCFLVSQLTCMIFRGASLDIWPAGGVVINRSADFPAFCTFL